MTSIAQAYREVTPLLHWRASMSSPPSPSDADSRLAAFRPVPRTGVIYVTVEAQKRGYHHDAPG